MAKLQNINVAMTNSIPSDLKPLQPYYQDQEIDLVDLWLVLYRRRTLFLGIVAVAIAIAIALIVLMPPVYESRAVVQIGHVGGIGKEGGVTSVEPPGVLIERLNEEYRVNDVSEGKREFPLIANVALNKGQQDIVTITARAHSVEDAQRYLATVVGKVQREHAQWLQEAVNQQHTRLDLLGERMKLSNQHMQALNESIAKLKVSNPLQAAVLLQEKSKFLQELPSMEQEQALLTLSLSRLQTLSTRFLREPTSPTSPERPRPVLYLSLALIIGIMLGTMAVFIAEFVTNARRRLRAPTNP